jgi:lipoyl-dependent peroxiredoxin
MMRSGNFESGLGHSNQIYKRNRSGQPAGRFAQEQIEKETPMAVRNAEAVWEGDLKSGKGSMKFGSGAFEGAYSYSSRFEEGKGTNPEELIGAAHAGCYSMALSNGLSKAGATVKRVFTRAAVTLGTVDGKARITEIHLDTEASITGVDAAKFAEIAEATKKDCPVSAALTGVNITLSARLV